MSSSIDADLLLQRFYHHVEARGGDIYLTQPVAGGEVVDYSFAEVFDEAARMAAYLDSLGFEPQSKIAIVSKNCAHFIIAELAIWMAGHVTVALYPTLSSGTANYILEHSDAKLLFVGKLDTWDELERGVPAGLPCVALPLAPDTAYRSWDDIVASAEPVADKRTRAADDESLIIYTSGSTGTPKGVVHSFRTISIPTKGIVAQLGINERERQISYLPLAHAMDRWLSGCVSLYAGSHLFFADSLDTFMTDLNRARPTVFLSVPRLWLKFQLGVYAQLPKPKLDRLLKIPIIRGIIKKKILAGLGLGHVRFAGSGSAPIPAELLQWYRDLGLELLEGYGMSENFSYSHLTRPGLGRPGYIGNAYPDVECKLSEAGEILVKSPGTMLGYYKQEALTREAFTPDGFLKTGDLGVIDAQQRLRITGRLKELFKTSKGKYVAPAPIENILNNDPNVELSLVAGSGMPKTHAVLQLSEELLPKLERPGVKQRITAELEGLLDATNAKIEEFERLGFLVVAKDRWTIEGEQLTPTMKIKRGVLEEMYGSKRDGWYAAGAKVIWEA
ncbi:AMP-binding protein [Enhygromyxa salina]|uniref:Long-chain-fatty-acid--CoA ligase FadD15 n=1 Tax=Enhygromyxa salina TaxID=215803 RepID=A0A2S9YYB4_9BACT|nr:AMP-binding protein [Enhygromyxa salina]PRQ10095.1 Long-chain-fatty-acid--CoA ligase FadD15 [Enhygromyxa salina]